MKSYILIAVFILTFPFNMSAYAQDAEETTPAPPPTSTPVEEKDKKETVFSRASDKQIEEAGNFYDSCTENETMSKLRDCKCAATAFLEKRIELGGDVTIKEIIAENINKCLKDEKNITEEEDRPDTTEVTEVQLEEAEGMLLECKSTLKLNKYYDCECYAARFLDERIKQGPLAPKSSLLLAFRNDCRNIIETTGQEYTQCMQSILVRPVRNVEPKPFCECYARKWADLFKNYEGLINMDSKSLMRLRARAFCKRTQNYK